MDLTKYNAKPEKTIQKHTDELLKALNRLKELGYLPSQHMYDLVKIACVYHDYGKANPEFQKRVNASKKIYFREETEVAHNVLSLFFLPEEEFIILEDYYRVGHAILNHHDYCDTLQILQDQNKRDLINILLNEFHEEIKKVSRKKVLKINNMIDDREAILIKGFLHKCDYSASAEMEVEYPNEFLTEKLEDLGYQWNALQKFCKNHTNKNIIAVAQTGMGKTEGGLHWIGDAKGFFILPIRTAINAIYDRVRKNILKENQIQKRVALLHSDALEYYNQNLGTMEMDLEDYYKRSKQLSIPLTICTMDQLFDFVFRYNGYEMKMAVLSYSKIVLDEIQMYSPDLLAYLICGMKKISEFGGKVAILTATLPPFVKDEIVQALGQEVEQDVFIDNKMKRHNIEVSSDSIQPLKICQKYMENIKTNKSNKILVVCNTVKKAQEIYTKIKEELSGKKVEIHLLHSRFIKEDRAEKEKRILTFGRTYTDEGDIDCRSGIWVATSIVEASLDIDFDYLFTELSDLNSLFQRFGRCNRKGVKLIEETNCYVFVKVDVGKNLDKTIYELSRKEIEGVGGILGEAKKLEMIHHCFTRENVCRSNYFKKYTEIKKYIEDIASHELKKSEVTLRNIMSSEVIPRPIYQTNEKEIRKYCDALKREHDITKKSKYQEYIKNLTVSIPSYITQKKETYIYDEIDLGKHNKIQVLECEYDNELGFREIDYSNYKRKTNLL